MDLDAAREWLALAEVPGVGPTTFKQLLEAFGEPRRVFGSSMTALLEVEGVGPVTALAIRNHRPSERIGAILTATRELGFNLITTSDADYPDLLRAMDDPPPFMFVQGSFSPRDRKALAVVGSRRCSPYGLRMASRLAGEAAGHGFTIVSGLARGIDAASHRAALEAGGRTIAVVGSGLDVVYPPEHFRLAREIADQGAVVGEHPPQTPPEREHFPVRNRIISGLSLGVLVIEAAAESGVHGTVSHALSQGREVFAVPGNVGSPTSAGTNRLIKQGAKLVESIDDLLEELVPLAERGARAQAGLADARPVALPPEEAAVVAFLGDEPLHIDDLTALSGLTPQKISHTLLQLELKGIVRRLAGQNFVKL